MQGSKRAIVQIQMCVKLYCLHVCIYVFGSPVVELTLQMDYITVCSTVNSHNGNGMNAKQLH